uniref:Transketolase-like pyrimidine-binding domain-containing protein n=1 Tax=Spongospora subterranea TaxID=70186 RepID=A0A0H5QGV0_9EUKA|eukprot:CRZ00827.1 hypothetical protein [Spongospora subterranea]
MLSRRISLRNCLRNRYFSQEVAAVSSLVDAYRRYGHLQADLDPLGRKPIIPVLELQPEFHRLELEETVRSEAIARCNLTAFPADSTVSNLLEFLRHRYCKTIGAEFMHIQDMAERQWLMEALERTPQPLTPSAQLNMLSLMVQSEILDEFMQKKFVSYKRYGLDGSEVFLVAIQTILANAASSAIKNVVIGMPHRGRSNVLLTILDYPPRSYFSKVKGMSHTLIAGQLGSDDVVSHLATSVNKRYDSGSVNVSVLHNPSHLEAVNPVALGKVRAIQDMDNDAAADRSMSVQFHGDAAFAGQGIVTESLQLSQLDSFYTGGTVHVILNNQIGFTTDPYRSRSGTYSSDVALMLQCPILHVNGDDPEATHRACALAVEYRQRFKKDAIVDLIAYRKFGHNEVDEPAFTQPTMYEVIRKRKSCAEKYALLLQSKGVRSRHVREKLNKKLNAFLEAELNESEKFVPDPKWNFNGRWTSMAQAQDMIGVIDTGVDANLLKKIGLISVTVPDDVKVHPRLVKSHIAARRQMVADGDALDWATAEAMAIGSLLHDGYNVRLAGQDVQRGTFSQRHATLTDQTNDKQYTPLCSPELGDAKFYPVNSPLSEAGVLGFEFGYSWHSPQNLNIWEAQFGDFWNPAQVIVDNFIATGEAKWIRQSGIVLLLPHGYDGAGPEHSSAKVERILQVGNRPALVAFSEWMISPKTHSFVTATNSLCTIPW